MYNFILTSVKVGNPDSRSKAVSFPGNSEKSTVSFKDSIRKAVRDRSLNEMKTDEGKGMISKSGSKLNIKSRENDKPVEESKEKQTDKKDNTIEEVLSKLEELANIQQIECMPADKKTVLLENIKEVMKELVEVSTDSSMLKDGNIQPKLAELTAVLDGMQKELETDNSLSDKEVAKDFTKGLKAIVAELIEKSETTSKTTTVDNNAELYKLKLRNIENEFSENQIAGIKSDKELSVQKSGENNNLTDECSMAKTVAEEQKFGIKTEASGTDTKPVIKDARPSAGESEETVKTALDAKVVKVTVSSKENKTQDAETGENKEASNEVHKAANKAQNNPIKEEMTVLKQEQIVVDNKLEVIQNQEVPVKAQNVSRSEIINQIVKKAEIILDDAQSEMRMQLEPENLGKLTLRVAVEKGLITAKFTAESYEVKQTIESSFNELKDMLQEKGLLIQNLSVSVGQNNSEYYNNNTFNQWKENVRLRDRSMNAGIYNGFLEVGGAAASKVNPYSVHNGKFDHRA